MTNRIGLIVVFTLGGLIHGCGGEPSGTGQSGSAGGVTGTESAPGATVFIISPKNGETVSSPVSVKFGVSGIAVAPAGDLRGNSGHHHLLVDAELPDMARPISSDETHLHYGKGQTEALIELAPGEHSLQLIMGDGLHIPHNPPVVSKPVVITVE
jgi:hypothetical protein